MTQSSARLGKGPAPKGVYKLDSGSWRVMKAINGEKFDHTFKLKEQAVEYAQVLDDARRSGAVPPTPLQWNVGPVTPAVLHCPRRIDELVRHSMEERAKDKKRSSDVAGMHGRWMKGCSGYLKNADVRNISREMIRDLRDFMQDPDGLNYEPSTTNQRLKYLRDALELAKSRGLVSVNHAIGVVAEDIGEDDGVVRAPLNFTEASLLASQFPPYLRLCIWLQFIMCLRISEVFGLQLRDWDPIHQVLHVRRQGGNAKPSTPGSQARTKTKAGNRQLFVPDTLANYIEAYIEEHHEPIPEGAEERAQWGEDHLLRTPKTKRPWQIVIRRRWAGALERSGLGQQSRGYRITTHYLRKSGSSWIGVRLTDQTWSVFMGHKVSAGAGVSAVTVGSYFHLPPEQLRRVAQIMETYIQDELQGQLDVQAAWCSDEYYTVAEAAEALGVGVTTIRRYRDLGRLLVVPSDDEIPLERYGQVSREDRVLITASSLEMLRAQRDLESEDHSVEDVMKVLRVSRRFVNNLREQGHLGDAPLVEGSYRISADAIEQCSQALCREREWLGRVLNASQAAAMLGMSDRYVRDLATQGRLPAIVPMGHAEPKYRVVDLERLKKARTVA